MKLSELPARALPEALRPAPVTIFVRELAVRTVIGVHEHERIAPRTLYVDVDIELRSNPGGRSDDLRDTVDYAAVVDLVRASLEDRRYFLLESASELVAQRILEAFGAARVRVRVAKEGVLEGVGRVGVEVSREAAA